MGSLHFFSTPLVFYVYFLIYWIGFLCLRRYFLRFLLFTKIRSLIHDFSLLSYYFLYFRNLARSSSRVLDFAVTTTNQAITALKLLRENKNNFDLVISDVHMPDMDGFKLLELVGLEMDLPVISKPGSRNTN